MTNLLNILLRGILRLQALLPLQFNRWLGRIFGSLSYRFKTRSAGVTRVNLELCYPTLSPDEVSALALESMRHTGMTVFETPSVWLRPRNKTRTWITQVENEALLDSLMAAETGTVVLLPHLGNWEMFNVYFADKGGMTALYQPPRQDWLKPLMSEIRGDNLVPTDRQGLKTLYKELEAGRVVTVLPDQVPASGDFAPFFGEPALTDRLVPRMIKKTRARAVVCIVYRNTTGFTVRFQEPDAELYSEDIQRALIGLNRSVENAIEDQLIQYQWEYKRFRERPAGYEKLYRFSPGPVYYHT